MKHTGRHTAEFILLFLAQEDSYGGKLLQKCEDELPVNPIDSAILYRTLKKLENENAITSYWMTSEEGKPIKMYKLTEMGKQKLDEFYILTQAKIKNLSFFMDQYSEWKASHHD
ncbi:PadR family transcriptional regulator [Longirhabdus pacifica]|uniref:PadR family transcriptional regulator n=1 Tax=Longirhabdus pacifica TaxID=2305227 RepID=UPI001008BB09|nr:PadR family transcriptional regulator [Longirhabdus pacifica]